MRPSSHLIILRLTTLGVALLLAGCEIPGMGPDPKIAARLADGKAIGSACWSSGNQSRRRDSEADR